MKLQADSKLGKTSNLEFHMYSCIFKLAVPASYSKTIQDVGIPWIFKNIQAHKSWKFIEILSSIFLQVDIHNSISKQVMFA